MATVRNLVPDPDPGAPGRAFSITDLSHAQRRALFASSNRRGSVRLAGHLGLVLVFGALIYLKVPYWPLLLVPQGIAVVFLFCAQHECVHRTAFQSRRCNDAVAAVCGWLVLLPTGWFRHFHVDHHRFTNDPARDPELSVAKPRDKRSYWLVLSGLPILWSRVKLLFGNALGRNADGFIPARARRRVAVEARWSMALYLLAFSTLGAHLLWVWAVPALLGQPFLRAFLLAEHTDCAHGPDMMANSRTTFTSRVVRFISWNMSFHAEHHAQPAVPFHLLPVLHRYVRPYLKVTGDSYINVNRAIVSKLRGSAKATEPIF